MELIGNLKNYEWGKLGLDSKVASLAKLNHESVEIDNEKPYSELWMGDHVSGPSLVKDTKKELGQVLTNDSSLVAGLDKLPFLFKVLSIEKALSIQVHPNKPQAEMLNEKFPDIYKDDNHKPELAIALTPFTALCGFRVYDEIHGLLMKLHPLAVLIGPNNVQKLIGDSPEDGLKICFNRLMNCSDDEIRTTIQEIGPILTDLEMPLVSEVFQKLCIEFPNDVGILAIFFLNIMQLNPGDAIFLAANEPHAYLSGDCVECMACSDNVIRAGLTPKLKDVETLIAMLNYQTEPAEKKMFVPTVCDKGVERLFVPPVKDFAVKEIKIQSHQIKTLKLKNWNHGSILLILQGNADLVVPNESSPKTIKLHPGSIVFIPHCTEEFSEMKFQFSGDEVFLAYQAFSNELIN